MLCLIFVIIYIVVFVNNFFVVCCFVGLFKVWVVVKVNVYGYGFVCVFLGLCGIDGFGLFDFDEVVKLCEFGWVGLILLFEGFFCLIDIDVIDCYSLIMIVYNDE